MNKEAKGFNLLLMAAIKGHDRVLRVLAQHNASLDVRDYSGQSALHISAALGEFQNRFKFRKKKTQNPKTNVIELCFLI